MISLGAVLPVPFGAACYEPLESWCLLWTLLNLLWKKSIERGFLCACILQDGRNINPKLFHKDFVV